MTIFQTFLYDCVVLKTFLRLSIQTVLSLSDRHCLVEHGILKDVTLKHTEKKLQIKPECDLWARLLRLDSRCCLYSSG